MNERTILDGRVTQNMRIAILDCDLDQSPETNGACIYQRLIPNSEIIPVKNGVFPKVSDYDGFVITGSRAKLTEAPYPWFSDLRATIRAIDRAQKPCLAICFGMELVADEFGGAVINGPKEQGFVEIEWLDPTLDFPNIVYESHQICVSRLPPGATLLARNSAGFQAFRLRNFLCTQFHPEIDYNVAEIMAIRDGDSTGEILSRAKRGYEAPRQIINNFF